MCNKITNDQIQIRIGIADGPIQMRKINIQNYILKDYFGTTVNMASRMESKVSKVGGFAILADSLPANIVELIKKHCVIQNVLFKYSCGSQVKRSIRLIQQDFICQDVKFLHIEDGKEHSVFSCELKT